MPRSTPQTVGRYAIHAPIASGGMATVHFARLVGPSGFARTLAVKRAHPHLVREHDFALMFFDEARLAARVQHPNVVGIVDVVQTDEELLLAMEYVHGESLWSLLKAAREKGERVPVPVAAAIVIDMLHGLHAAHEAKDPQGQPLGIVHRDVSPQNVLVGADGVTRLVDFGIAKAAGNLHATRDSTVKGKFAYMAPEQARGEEVSRLTDVYSAAIVFWELLTGERLFAGRTDAETVHKALVARVWPPSRTAPDVSEALDAVVLHALEREPARRYQTAREMALAIEGCVPAVRASEVAAWVQRLAADTLAERAAVLEAIEREDASGTPEGAHGAPAAERVSLDPGEGATVVAAEPAPVSAPPQGPGSPLRSWRTWAVVAGGIASLGLAAIVLRPASVAREGAPQEGVLGPSSPAAAAPSSSPAPGPIVPGAPVVVPPGSSLAATSPTPPPAPSEPATASEDQATAHHAPLVKHPTRPGHAGHPRRTAACDPPYSIDAEGRQIFKPECM